jgi:AcrR family transcriptional regulator
MSRSAQTPARDGLRNRKKQQTRKTIATVAAELFNSRGYENVRMRDIAHAADVSEQTLYNYFPTKEHLVFDQQQEFEARILAAVLKKPPDIPISAALQPEAEQFLEELARNVGKTNAIPGSVAVGPDLRRVWIEMNARNADSLAEALLRAGKTHDRLEAKFIARTVVALFAVILEGVGEAALAGRSRAWIRKQLRSSIQSISAILQKGLRMS